MLLLFYFLLLTKQQRDVELDNHYYWTSSDKLQDDNIYRIQNLNHPYYYVQISLVQEDMSFILIYDLDQIPKVNTSRGDYISSYENRTTRFLKIIPNGKIIYISTHSKLNQGNYNITIWGSVDAYCDNGCSNSGKCYDNGCECNSGYVGSDCHQTAMEIYQEKNEIYFYGDEIQFFYLNMNTQEDAEIQLKLSTNNYQGIEIIQQLTDALIIPSQINLSNEDSYIKQYQIYDTQPLDLILYSHSPSNNYQYYIFAARPINGNLNTIVNILTIECLKYDNYEDTISTIEIIIIVVAISAVIIIMILFFVIKNCRKSDRTENEEEQQQQQNHLEFYPHISQQECYPWEICRICQENLINNQMVQKTINCQHKFHSKCIIEYEKNKRDCPDCSYNLAIKDVKTHLDN